MLVVVRSEELLLCSAVYQIRITLVRVEDIKLCLKFQGGSRMNTGALRKI